MSVSVFSVFGQEDWESQARALRPSNSGPQELALLDGLEQRARTALSLIPRAQTKSQVESGRERLRRRLEQALGFRTLPWPPDLQSKRTGILEQEGYRIEKIVFQTLPGTWASGHLYLPDALTGAAPAVLVHNGHWWQDSKVRPDFQAFCINMARLGFAVFSFDPLGQGERGVSMRDHRHAEALLVGISQQGIMQYETRCALEYLLSRSEVDKRRIGMTGVAGGAYNSWVTAALDDRIAVVVPVAGTTDLVSQIESMRSVDWDNASDHCHFVPGMLRFADYHELLAMVAPRPVLIVAGSTSRLFPVAGARRVYEYGTQLYRAFGAGDRISFLEDNGDGAEFDKTKREAAYAWFLRWLMGKGGGQHVAEPPVTALSVNAPDLRCFNGVSPPPAGPMILAAVRRLAGEPRIRTVTTDLERLMGDSHEETPMSFVVQIKKVQRVVLEVEREIHVPVVVLRPGPEGGEPAAGILVAMDDRGKESVTSDPVVVEALSRNWMIWCIDPRGIGELATQKSGWLFGVSLLLGENPVWRQGWDIRRVADYAAHATMTHRVGVYARGHNTSLAATYALATAQGSAPAFAVLRDGFISFRHFLDQQLNTSFQPNETGRERGATNGEIPYEYMLFGALRTFDLPDLLRRTKARTLVVDPINGDWNRIDPRQARAILPSSVQIASVDEVLNSDIW